MRSRLAILLLVAAGCASTENIEDGSDLATQAKRTDRSIVFGRIRLIQNGEEKEIGDSYFELQLTPHLLRMQDKERIHAEVDEGGHFVWSLTPGTYLIHMVVYRDPWSGSYQLIPKAAFAVPENGRIYYVGTLEAVLTTERDILGKLRGTTRFSVWNEKRAEEQRLRGELGLETRPVANSIMVRDERLPKSVETTEAFRIATVILTGIGVYGVGRH
ncbi:MAG: hypothetical protein ACYTGZ_13390 [Planctomycetota bacterium]|jgi:hypothetical protein